MEGKLPKVGLSDECFEDFSTFFQAKPFYYTVVSK